MKGLAYEVSRLTVAVGTTITWSNHDPVGHTVTADDGSFDSGVIAAEAVWSHQFDRPGTYAFTCTLHPFMKGTVVVR